MIRENLPFVGEQGLPGSLAGPNAYRHKSAKLALQNPVEPSHHGEGASFNNSSINIELGKSDNSISKILLKHNRVAEAARLFPAQGSRPAFAQRHPWIARFFSVSAAILAAPFIITATIVTGPALMLLAACSDRFSRWIGKSWYGRCLWGELADSMATDEISRDKRLVLGALSFIGITSVLGIRRTYEEVFESLDTYSLPPRLDRAAKAQGSRLSPRMYTLGEAEQSGQIPFFRNGERMGCVRADVLSSSDRPVHALFDMDDDPYTGIGPDITGLTCCAYYNGLPLDIVPQAQDLLIRQGDAGNCYALTILYGLLQNGRLNAKLSEKCHFNRDGSLTIVLSNTRDVVKSLERGGLAEYMKNQGYAISKDSRHIEVTLSEKKLGEILAEQQGKDQFSRTCSNSLFVLVMEHFIGNLVRLKADTSELEPSLRLQSIPHRDRIPDAGELVANLFACSMEAAFWPGMPQTELSRLLKKYKSTDCLRDIDRRAKPGFIYLSLELDNDDGSAPERHAFALQDVELDERGEVQGVVLINPHDTGLPEKLSLMELRRRGAIICKVESVH
jgi:hypothetical protein